MSSKRNSKEDKNLDDRLEEINYHRWQTLRRTEDYKEATRDLKFQEDGEIDYENYRFKAGPSLEDLRDLANKFGLMALYHPSTELPRDVMLSWPIWEDVGAVKCIWNDEDYEFLRPWKTCEELGHCLLKEKNRSSYRETFNTVLSNSQGYILPQSDINNTDEFIHLKRLRQERYLLLKIDIFANKGQIAQEVMDMVEDARLEIELEQKKGSSPSYPSEDDYRVYDLVSCGDRVRNRDCKHDLA